MFNACKLIVKLSKNSTIANVQVLTTTTTRLSKYSTVKSNVCSAAVESDSNGEATTTINRQPTTKKQTSSSSPMVAAVFASLHKTQNVDGSEEEIKTPHTDQRIAGATTVDDLLSISDGSGVSKRHALKVISVLTDWSTSGKIKLSDIETDPRFVRLCRILTKSSGNVRNHQSSRNGPPLLPSNDLSTVLGIRADDEAAKLIGSITLPQMVKVMSTLSVQKRRSTPLLRSLSFNISRSGEQLDLKQSADLLYSMSVLNFPDSLLLERIGNDLTNGLEQNIKKSSVVGSILTSLGLLRYHSSSMLDLLSDWMMKNHEICRPYDVYSLLLTLAVVNYQPPNADQLFHIFIPQINSSDAQKPSTWVDVVWSLVLLNRATPEHISSVLKEEFIAKLNEQNGLSALTKMKVLHINTAASLLTTNYKGPLLNNNDAESINKVVIMRTKEKEALVNSLIDTLNTLLPAATYCKSNINNGWGFLIDGECLFDTKFNPIPVTPMNKDGDCGVRIAVLVQDYTDLCRGRAVPTGVNVFVARVLQRLGYKILDVPHTEFDKRDKLIRRVQYLETKLKALVQAQR